MSTTNQGFARTGPFKEGYSDAIHGLLMQNHPEYDLAQELEYLAAYRQARADLLTQSQTTSEHTQ
jgi:hypothetical protein